MPKVPDQHQLQNIRLSADVANPLSTSRYSRADRDGCVGLHLRQVLHTPNLRRIDLRTSGDNRRSLRHVEGPPTDR